MYSKRRKKRTFISGHRKEEKERREKLLSESFFSFFAVPLDKCACFPQEKRLDTTWLNDIKNLFIIGTLKTNIFKVKIDNYFTVNCLLC
jgi:hypothetical protein